MVAILAFLSRYLISVGDPKLFNEIPVRFFFDAMDFAILTGLLAATVSAMFKLVRG